MDAFDIEYSDISYIGILTLVRDYIHKGHRLITHPLSGSVKPKETPYKSVLISADSVGLDAQSLSIIEESIACVDKFRDYTITCTGILNDFMEIDCSLIESMSEQRLKRMLRDDNT